MKSIAKITELWYNVIVAVLMNSIIIRADTSVYAARREGTKMFDHKRIAAFTAALLIGFSAAPAFSPAVYADEAAETSEDADLSVSEDTAAEPPADTPLTVDSAQELKESGGFKYSVTDENTACIQDCTLTDADLVIPSELDGLKVTELGKRALGNTEGLPFETVTIPAGIEYISSDAPFVFCDKLREIKVDPANKNYVSVDGILFTADKKTLVCYPQKKSGSSYSVPEGVERLGTAALYATELKEITVPSSLAEVGPSSFNSIKGLASIDLSKTSVTDIDAMAFAECSSLKEIKLPSTLEGIQGGAFWGCASLAEIELPDGLVTIGQNAFMDTAMTFVIIPESVQQIAYCAFGYESSPSGGETAVSSFTVVGAPNSAAQQYATDSDPEYDYKNEFDFKTIQQYELQKEIESYEHKTEGDYEIAVNGDEAYLIFCMSGEKEISVPAEIAGYKLTTIYPAAFSNCTATRITLPEGVTTIRETAFYNCQYMKELVLPQSLEIIGADCFSNCIALEDVDLGGTVTLGTDAFVGCTALRHVKISGNCESLGEHLPFTTCTALEEIEVTSGDGAYSSKDGILYDHDGEVLVEYPLNREGSIVRIPEGVKEIGDFSFAESNNIEDVVLPKSLEAIGRFAFHNCFKLKKLRVYKNVSEIGECAFGMQENPAYVQEDESQNPYQTSSSDEKPQILIEGFKLYTSKNSAAYDFAKEHDIEVITGTVRIGDKNVSIAILAAACSCAGALVIAAVTSVIIKKRKNKRTSGKKKNSGKDKKDEA